MQYASEIRAYNGRAFIVAAVIVATKLVVNGRTKRAETRQQHQYGVDGLGFLLFSLFCN
jgi:hypothetical protein